MLPERERCRLDDDVVDADRDFWSRSARRRPHAVHRDIDGEVEVGNRALALHEPLGNRGAPTRVRPPGCRPGFAGGDQRQRSGALRGRGRADGPPPEPGERRSMSRLITRPAPRALEAAEIEAGLGRHAERSGEAFTLRRSPPAQPRPARPPAAWVRQAPRRGDAAAPARRRRSRAEKSSPAAPMTAIRSPTSRTGPRRDELQDGPVGVGLHLDGGLVGLDLREGLPVSIGSPSFFSHRRMRPSSIVSLNFGITTLEAMLWSLSVAVSISSQ